MVGAHRPCDVLDLLLAHIVERDIELSLDIAADPTGHSDGAWFGERFEPGGNIHPVAKYVAVLDENVTGGS